MKITDFYIARTHKNVSLEGLAGLDIGHQRYISEKYYGVDMLKGGVGNGC